MKLLVSLALLLQSLAWLEIANAEKSFAPAWHERDIETAATFHRMWMAETWPA